MLLTFALLPRLLLTAFMLAMHPWGHPFNVSSELALLAQSLVHGKGLSSPFGGDTGPTAFLAPGYPLVIAALFKLFGSFTQASAAAMLLLHSAFGVATAFAIHALARRTLDVRTANVAAIVWSLWLPFVWLTGVFWDTSLSCLLLPVLLLLGLHCARAAGERRGWLLLGAVSALTLLVNPSLVLTVLAVFAWAMWQGRRCGVKNPILGLVLMIVLFAPWPLRNERQLHAFIPLRSNFNFELWKGNLPGANGVDDASLYPATNVAEFTAYAREGEVAYMRRKGAEARATITSNLARFLKLSVVRFVRYWTGFGTGDFFAACHVSLMTLLTLAGLVCLLRERRCSVAALFLLPMLLFPLPYYITHAELRFQVMLEPVSLVLVAFALTRLYRLRRQQ